MRWMRRYTAAAGLMMAALLSGCPSPVLNVSPGAINFAPEQSAATVRISNLGGGALNWQVEEDLLWLSSRVVSKQANASGSATTEPDVVEFLVDRAQLPIGVTRGDVLISSNGGNFTLPVSAQKNGPAIIEVSADALDFGATTSELGFSIFNRGLEPLTWTIPNPQNAPWLTVTPRSGTISTQNGSQVVSASVSRDSLPPGEYQTSIIVNSNGRSDDPSDNGTRTLTVSLRVIPFSVTPDSLAVGTISATRLESLTVRNLSGVALNFNYTATTADGAAWLSVDSAPASIPAGGQGLVDISLNPSGLAAGTYTGAIAISAGGFDLSVPVNMGAASLTAAPALIDFGTLPATETQNLTVTNLLGAPIDYTLSVRSSDQAWLSVSPDTGTVTNVANHTVTANPAAIEPGQYEGIITLSYPGGSSTVRVTASKQRPARLVAVSENVNFGTTGVQEQIDIWNDGLGVVNWSISTAGFPAWLSLDGVAPGASIGGTVQGEQTDSVTLRVDRSLAPADQFNFTHTFQVIGTGDFNGAVNVTANMSVPQIAEIELVADGVDDNGVDFINFDVTQVSKTFIIRNNGNGILQWNFVPAQLPFWIAGITPAQGGVNPGTEQTVTVTVDRTGLDFRGAQVQLGIINNDPSVTGGVLPFIVEVQVPKRVAITGRPSSLAFGPDESIGLFEIANDGDPGTELLYRIRSTKEDWLKVFPENGSSIGTEANIKDFKLHTAAIVRSKLEGSGSSGKLIVEAIRTNELGQIEVLPDVQPLEITVSVEAAELTFQHALPRLRVPSLARFVMLMRNVRFSPIPISETRLTTLADQISLFENDQEVELTETAKVIKGPGFIRGNMLILLDYSNSMQESARAVGDPAISGAVDPLQALYERTITQLLDEIPSNYRVGLAVFSERSGTGGSSFPREALRPIFGTGTEGPETEGQLFLDDRALLQDRLANIVVATNGATELYPALRDASALIVEEDNIAGIFPYDDADDRIILCVTDGRATTPPGEVTDVTDQLALVDLTRTFVIGWGNGVSTGPLVQLATETGGHVYATQTERVDVGGGVLRDRPVVEELENYCVTVDADPCDLSIKRDLDAQYLFSYVSLNEEGNVEIEGRLTFDDPNDQASTCLPEQGEISGKFTAPQTPFNLYAGDPRLGQVKLLYSGVNVAGQGQVTVYMDSAPRDVRRMTFQLSTAGTAPLLRSDVVVTSRLDGGLISDWTQSGGGLTFTFESASGAPLTYGDFGPLFTINLSGIGAGSLLNFSLTEPVFASNDPNGKYFTSPSQLRLDTGAFTATSFPRPGLELFTVNGVDPDLLGVGFERDAEDRLFFDLGQDVNEFEMVFFNLGGFHNPSSVDLQYTIIPNAQGIVRQPADVNPDFWAQPICSTTLVPQVRRFIVDRNILPVQLDGRDPDTDFEIEFEYLLRNIGYFGDIEPLYLVIEVTPPVLSVAPGDITVPVGVTSANTTISNTGQGSLTWTVDPATEFPSWLNLSALQGGLGPEASETLTLNFDRADPLLPPGSSVEFSFDIVFEGESGEQRETIEITVNS